MTLRPTVRRQGSHEHFLYTLRSTLKRIGTVHVIRIYKRSRKAHRNINVVDIRAHILAQAEEDYRQLAPIHFVGVCTLKTTGGELP